MTEMTWASIVPLIGGESIGLMNALGGKLPEYVLSFKAFEKNDSHFINYLRHKGWKGDYIVIDDNPDMSKIKYVDIVNTVCPCAGLSSLIKKPEAGCAANDWMYLTTDFVLKHISPAVLWGENAPKFSTNVGKGVRDTIYEKAKEAGYSFSVYRTSSIKHGTPQNRERSFYFLWNDNKAPIMNWFDKPHNGYLSQLGTRIKKDPMDIIVNNKGIKPSETPWYSYLLEEVHQCTHKEYTKQLDRDVCAIWEVAGGMNKKTADWSKFIKWCDKNKYIKEAERARYMQDKINAGKNIWAKELILIPPKGATPAFVAIAPTDWVHPTQDRYLTVREGMRMMGLPDDFQLLGGRKNINHVCQNVPVPTAQDMADQVIKWLRGELFTSHGDYVIQNNLKQTNHIFNENEDMIEYPDIENTLSQFLETA